MNRNDSPISSEQGPRSHNRRDRGSVMLELSVIVVILTIFAATAVGAVSNATTHAAAIGCQVHREEFQVATIAAVASDPAEPALGSGRSRRAALADHTPMSDHDPHAAGVATPQENSSC